MEEFSRIPGIVSLSYLPQRYRLEFVKTDAGEVSYPPVESGPHSLLVSALDEDCNDVAGIRLPEIAVPLGTYLGWNVRKSADDAPGLMTFGAPLLGSTIPFARTKAERIARGDPRLSIEERYSDKRDYLARVRQCAMELVDHDMLLAEDIELCERLAEARWEAFT
jgi:hypothetical protein